MYRKLRMRFFRQTESVFGFANLLALLCRLARTRRRVDLVSLVTRRLLLCGRRLCVEKVQLGGGEDVLCRSPAKYCVVAGVSVAHLCPLSMS